MNIYTKYFFINRFDIKVRNWMHINMHILEKGNLQV